MTLEQRVESLAIAITNMAAQQSNAEVISEIVRNVTDEVNANARHQAGELNAVQGQTAYKLALGINYDQRV